MNKYLLKSYFTSTFLLFLTLLLIIINTSCSKKDGNNVVSGKATLTFKIDGVKEVNIVSNSKASLNNMIGLKVNDYNHKETIKKDDYSFEIISEQSNITEDQVEFSKEKRSKIASTSMENDIHYRLIVLTLADELVASVDVKVGELQHISVTPGNSYKWKAFSFNSTSPTPTINMNNPIIETPTTETLLYASGSTEVINDDGYIIPIVFSHQLTQLQVRVGITEKDNFRTINQVTGEFIGDAIKKCDFNVITGQKSTTLTPVDVGPLTFTQLTSGSNRTLVAKNYYTADESYTTYSIKINSLSIYNKSTESLDITPSLPTPSQGVKGQVNFLSFTGSNKGNILLGRLDISINKAIDPMKIVAFSDLTTYGYKLDPNTASGNFIRSSYNFGPTSNYVKIEALDVTTASNGLNSYIATNILNNPANYPDILVIANATNYLNQASWDAVIAYLNAGGNVFYTQDAVDNLAMTNISLIFNETLTNTLVNEGAGVSKFTDTPEAQADIAIIDGPFGNVTDYMWGQDVAGTTYVNYSAENSATDNIIAYSTKSQNYANPGPNKTSFFRHKTKSFFYVGDGGFLANIDPSGQYGAPANWNIAPFRTIGGSGVDRYFPVISKYGVQAQLGSPTYEPPHIGANVGTYDIANSMIFGNIISWMLHRANFYPVNRN